MDVLDGMEIVEREGAALTLKVGHLIVTYANFAALFWFRAVD